MSRLKSHPCRPLPYPGLGEFYAAIGPIIDELRPFAARLELADDTPQEGMITRGQATAAVCAFDDLQAVILE